jgi:hypothetical protein
MFMILNYFHWFPHEMYFFTVYTYILCINIKKTFQKGIDILSQNFKKTKNKA